MVPSSVEYHSLCFTLQVVTYESVASTEPAVEGQETERGEIETVGREGAQRPTHVAFGSKVPIPEHILTSRKVQMYNINVLHSKLPPRAKGSVQHC